jgi:cytochrome c553
MTSSDGKEFSYPRAFYLSASLLALLLLAACHGQLRKSDAELGLSPQQSAGRRIYDQYCDRCHEGYSSRDKNGPSLEALFKKPYMRASGLPANDVRTTEIILSGRGKMRGFGDVLSQQQVNDLLAYLHTL